LYGAALAPEQFCLIGYLTYVGEHRVPPIYSLYHACSMWIRGGLRNVMRSTNLELLQPCSIYSSKSL